MSSNFGGSGAIAIVRTSRQVELDLYDGLPARWRELIDSLPVLQAIGPICEYCMVLGDGEAYRRVVREFQQRFAGWAPPEPQGSAPGRRDHSPALSNRPPRRGAQARTLRVPSRVEESY